ncbi:porin [Parathalassolituus penaei]|uniref:Porin n=1 Tax=Parathalassolituus penaei TaxID=2997323 RepID=A0A9X3EHH9_9GAMM|nr:porin [Parathalassolituus penaei]MCY0967305.1 porin [Parathalassolituus penaei]
MHYKKLSLAVAVAAVCSQPALAVPNAEIYGFVDMGLEQYSESGAVGGADIFQGGYSPTGNSNDQTVAMSNNVTSRIGVRGKEAHESGWTGSYNLEFAANVLDNGGDALATRQGWLALSKGDHEFKFGAQWSPLFGYSAWNTNQGEAHGLASYYYVVDQLPGSMAYGFRNDSTMSYTYGSGPYADSPFTGTVALHIAEDNRKTDAGDLVNDSGITGYTLGAASSFGAATINAAYAQSVAKQSDAARLAGVDVTEPYVWTLGGKYQASKQLGFGLAYRVSDNDTGVDSKRYSLTGSVQYSVDNLDLHAGVAKGEAEDDSARQLDGNFFTQAIYHLSESRHVRFEYEQVDYGSDGDAHVVLVSMRQSF